MTATVLLALAALNVAAFAVTAAVHLFRSATNRTEVPQEATP